MTATALLALPRSIYIELTSRCNELCQQCPRTLLSREDDRDLSFEKFRQIIDQFPALDRVVLHGLGEPLLNKELPLMISYLQERVLGNVFQELMVDIWNGERYNAFRDAFESDLPARHCSQCGVNRSY